MEPSTLSLEAELATIAENAEPGRTAQIAIRCWGWDGRGGATLETTGREFGGITRERVRQLCERLAKRLGASALAGRASLPTPIPAPTLERALLQFRGIDEAEIHDVDPEFGINHGAQPRPDVIEFRGSRVRVHGRGLFMCGTAVPGCVTSG